MAALLRIVDATPGAAFDLHVLFSTDIVARNAAALSVCLSVCLSVYYAGGRALDNQTGIEQMPTPKTSPSRVTQLCTNASASSNPACIRREASWAPAASWPILGHSPAPRALLLGLEEGGQTQYYRASPASNQDAQSLMTETTTTARGGGSS
ncbi:uncharacterized protein LY79DRAFT_582801 [Colletotrichum navitas]|uniref:Uncharacterized protein n=1 Tax=Colletotrichum navitas TaxID=681940 RepID=A0AAD8PRP2_9PEZI|nr:uncharacterized protein LY79DRAFT_582801 [Colletotrichum navitas]KAK1574668.1 hypothetical protein LY79DRAFT_582801 [Colletotrichum navitas]